MVQNSGRIWGYSSMAQRLPGKNEVMRLIPCKKEKKKKRMQGKRNSISKNVN